MKDSEINFTYTNTKHTVQIDSVFPGPYGGAIFKGTVIGKHSQIRCKANWNVISRIPREGEFWDVSGQYVKHPDYGEQLAVFECHLVNIPATRYVSSLLVKHPAFKGFYLGPAKVKALVEKFGIERLFDLLNNGNVYLISQVISYAIAKRLIDEWTNLQEEIETINFLIKHRFPPELTRKVLYLCKHDTVERLRSNPYALVPFGGLSRNFWRTIESCARRLGFDLGDEKRLVGAVEHILYQRLRKGHTAIPVSILLKDVGSLLKAKSRAEKALGLALKNKAVCVLYKKSEPMIQLIGPAFIEMELERRLSRLLTGPVQLSLFSNDEQRLKVEIEKYSDKLQEPLTKEQKDAVLMALTNRCSIITGFGGTGKTTTLKAVAEVAKIAKRDVFTVREREVFMMALAGKAKERIRQATKHTAYTIHAFIKAAKKVDSNIFIDNDPLIIIDEASMVDVALFNELLSLFDKRQFNLLTVGDPAQISPVGFGLVWHKMVASKEFPITHLTKSYRQGSSLHELSMQVRLNHKSERISLPIWNGEQEGVFLVPVDKKGLREKLGNLKIMEFEGKLPPIQILTPHMSDRFPDSGNKINRYIQKGLNSDGKGFRLGQIWVRIGDPVIVTANNYELGLFNGTTGILQDIEIIEGEIVGIFSFDGETKAKRLKIDEMYDIGIKLAYALSFHKSQGSEYPATAVSCVVDTEMVERSLIYTAITRAKKLCLIVGSEEVFNIAANKPPRAETLDVGFMSRSLLNLGKTAGP